MEEQAQREHIIDWERDIGRGNHLNVNILQHWLRYHIALKHIKPGDKVLEIGFGHAYLPRILYTNRVKTDYFGVELTSKSVEAANLHKDTPKWLYGHEEFSNSRFGSDKPPEHWEKGSFDVVFTSHVIEHMPKAEGIEFLREAMQYLKVGGKFLIACPDGAKKELDDYHIYEWALDELRDFFAYYGYEEYGCLSQQNTLVIEEVLKAYPELMPKYKQLKELLPRSLLIPIFSLFLDDKLEDIFLFFRKKKDINREVPKDLSTEREGHWQRTITFNKGYFT